MLLLQSNKSLGSDDWMAHFWAATLLSSCIYGSLSVLPFLVYCNEASILFQWPILTSLLPKWWAASIVPFHLCSSSKIVLQISLWLLEGCRCWCFHPFDANVFIPLSGVFWSSSQDARGGQEGWTQQNLNSPKNDDTPFLPLCLSPLLVYLLYPVIKAMLR